MAFGVSSGKAPEAGKTQKEIVKAITGRRSRPW